MNTQCHAPDMNRHKRERHKPALGIDESLPGPKFIISCVWCGKTLERMELEEARKLCMVERVEQALDGYGV